MKKTLLLVASAALLLAGCAKERTFVPAGRDGEMMEVAVTTLLEEAEPLSRAVADEDGRGAKVNHWVMEVRDAQNSLFIREERNDVPEGTLTQDFKLKLFKNQSYTLQFWADTKGAYSTGDLTSVSRTSFTANLDSFDAFSANVSYYSDKSELNTVILRRPFGQLNIITTDLKALKEIINPNTYPKYEPTEFKLSASIPTTFNVRTQTAGDPVAKDLTASNMYAQYKDGAPETTLFMDYIFASEDKVDIVNFGFSFKTRETVEYNFTSIPMRRNYRTNIKGQLLSNDSEWKVVIDPIWKEPENNENK